MGESACLMQPFCYASGILNESSNQNINSIHALGQSVSFGRFTSESLSWEKWSSFSSNSNRYVEEAERYSRPGSVAQKKAFFEAHYKRLAAQRAAALLEQQANNAAASNNVPEQALEKVVDDDNIRDSQTSRPNSELDVNEDQNVEISNSKPEVVPRASGYALNSNMDTNRPESWKADPTFVESSKKDGLRNQLEDVNNQKEVGEKVSSTPPVNKWLLRQNSKSEQEILASISKKKPSVSFSMLLKENAANSKFNSTPVKSAAPISSIQHNVSSPMSSKNALNSADKKNSTPKSVQKPMNFTPIRELNRLTASVMRRFENSRVAAASSMASKDNPTPLRTPTMASKNEGQKHCSMTPLTERRTKTPIDSSVSGSNTAGSKWRLLSAEKKPRSPIISSPFCLRTEERAARRKKKLEEKFNADETQKVQLHTKLREKAETEIRKLRQSLCFKARPLPEFYKERKASENEINKEPVLNESPKQGRKPAPLVVESKISLPPQKSSVKSNGTKNFQAKNRRTLLHAFTSKSMMITPENTSPNIQLGNQNDRTYKYNF